MALRVVRGKAAKGTSVWRIEDKVADSFSPGHAGTFDRFVCHSSHNWLSHSRGLRLVNNDVEQAHELQRSSPGYSICDKGIAGISINGNYLLNANGS